MNTVYVVGIGPGKIEYMTCEAETVLKSVDTIVGYTVYIELIKPYFPGKEYISTGMTGEKNRCETAVALAVKGKRVAVVSSGDSGIYGMAGLVYEIAFRRKEELNIEVIAGITAASAAAAALGAPLMHDFSVISLSDLMTPLELIFKRVRCAAEGDFIICFYNPKSKKRVTHLARAAQIIMEYRSAETPVGIVRNAGREDEKKWVTTLDALADEPVDMFCTVIIGNSTTYIEKGTMITPRGYEHS